MIQVKKNKVVRSKLPNNDYLKNGQAVSGYKNLPVSKLEKEDWVEPKEVIPALDKDHLLGAIKYEQQKGEWVKTYELKEKPQTVEPEVDPLVEIKKRLDILEGKEVI